jgi:transposase, IS6 family
MAERGLNVKHTTIMRWVHQYSPIIDERVRKHLKNTNDSWRMDETYIKIKGKDAYLYRAVDSEGNTIDFHVSKNRDKKSAKKFFKKALRASHNQQPRVITIDKSAATEMLYRTRSLIPHYFCVTVIVRFILRNLCKLIPVRSI